MPSCGTTSRTCAGWIGPIRWRRGKQHLACARRAPRLPESQAVRRAEVFAARDRSHARAAGGHIWVSGRVTSRNGIPFAAESPDRGSVHDRRQDRVDGTVRSTKPLSYGGTLIEDFTLAFEDGRVVEPTADRGEPVLRQLLRHRRRGGAARRSGAGPHGSPVSQSGRLFYNTLFDENAASHVALGSAYRFTLDRRRRA